MPKLPRIPSILAIKALKRARFYEYHYSGSHLQLRHSEKTELRVTIPFSKKDLAPKTLKSILKQAGITVNEFIDLIK
ncbi:MAG: type II toxin-antitoxin system HicA family toxin [bacterium]